LSENVFQELKIRAQLDPVVRRRLASYPLQYLARLDLNFEEKLRVVLPHFSWIIEKKLAAMPFPATEDAYLMLQQLGIEKSFPPLLLIFSKCYHLLQNSCSWLTLYQ
jgi:hypothetical protein